jgi:hypothetical protein
MRDVSPDRRKGIGGVKPALALRDPADISLSIAVVSPESEVVYRPLTVAERPAADGCRIRLPRSGNGEPARAG